MPRSDFAGRKVHHRSDTKIYGDTDLGDTRVHTHETITGRDPGARLDFGVLSHGMGAAPSRRAVSPVMRVPPTSMESDLCVSDTACDTPNKELDIAAHDELPTLSAEIPVHSAVSVPVYVDGTMTVEGAERVQ